MLHLTVHVLGLAVAAGLVLVALRERAEHPARTGIAVGGALLLASHLVVGALVADPAGWPLLLRTAGYAALAVGAAGRLVGGPAVVAVLPPLAHLAAALAGAAAALATARGVLGRGRAVAPLAVGVLLWAAADLVVSTRPEAASALSVVGSLSVGSWVVGRAGAGSLAGRFVAGAMAVLLVLTVALATASGALYTTDLRAEQAERLDAVASARATELADAWPRELETTAALLTGAALVAELQDADVRDGALDGRAGTITALPGIDLALLVDDAGAPLGSAWGDDGLAEADAATLAGDGTVALALAGDTARGLVTLGDSRLVAVGSAPVVPTGDDGSPERDRTVGALLVGRTLGGEAVVTSIAADTGADAALLVDGRPVASTLPTAAGPDLGLIRAPGTVELAGEERTVARAPLAAPDGSQPGSLVLALPSGATADVADAATRSTFLVAAVGLLVAGGLAVALSRRLTGPVRELTAAAERVTAGDLATRVAVEGRDEVGRLAGAFDEMTVSLARREEELQAAATTEAGLRGRLEAVTAAMGEALLATDGHGRVTLANPAAVDLLGSGEEVVGARVQDVLVGTVDGGRTLVDAAGAPPDPDPVAVRGQLPGGEVVAATAAALADENGEIGRVYVLRDVTSQAAADRLRTEIVANVSHELRTPLTPIVGYLELLRARELDPPRVREFAEQGALAAERLQGIVEKFIDLADLEAGNTPVEVGEVAVAEVVSEVVDRWRGRLGAQRVQRRVRRDLPSVVGDPRLLARALDELVENAGKFSHGPVRVIAEREDVETVRITVRDDGPGIDAEEIERVLADFEQADGSATRRVGGLGLGLSIAQRLLGRLDARLEMGASPGGGTDATVRLRAVTR